jgi:hypothetical protein
MVVVVAMVVDGQAGVVHTDGSYRGLSQHRKTDRDIVPWRKAALLAGETARKRLKVPRLMVTD